MNDRLSALEQDIGFLKSLAVEGRPATLIGGSILVAAGVTFGVASVAQWVVFSGLTPTFGPWMPALIWGLSFVIFMIELALILRRPGPHQAGDAGNRAISGAWTGAGFTIFALVMCAMIVAWRTQSDAAAMLIPSMVLSVYGLCWTVAAKATRKGWVWACALGSYAAAGLVAVFCTGPSIYLIYAAALVAVAVAPGLVLMRQARTAA